MMVPAMRMIFQASLRRCPVTRLPAATTSAANVMRTRSRYLAPMPANAARRSAQPSAADVNKRKSKPKRCGFAAFRLTAYLGQIIKVTFLLIDPADFCSWNVFSAVLAVSPVAGVAALGTLSKSQIIFTWNFSVFCHNRIKILSCFLPSGAASCFVIINRS